MSMKDFLKTTRTEVDKELEKVIEQNKDFEGLREALGKGKRLRPVLALLVFKACGGEDYRKAIKAAVAMELTHCASLVHDDLLDKDKERRGKPSVPKVLGVDNAVLLGHRMVSLGLKTVVNHGAEIIRTFLDVWDNALKGETKDLGIMKRKLKKLKPPIKTLYFDILMDKTASLFAGSAKLGAQEAGATPDLQKLFWNYGQKVGLAYQLADDYIDMKKGKIETLPLIIISQLEDNVKKSFFEIIEEGKVTPMTMLDRIGFDCKQFFMSEIEKAVNEAKKLAVDKRIEDSEFKKMLKKAPAYFVNLMFKEVGEEWL